MQYNKIKKQISYTAIYKIIIILLNFILIKYLLEYLGNENFGIYIALTSLFSWMFLFDLGIAKGTRNYVTIALSKNNINEAKAYISTSYISILVISIISFLIIITLVINSNLSTFFNINIENQYLNNIFLLLVSSFFIKFYLGIVDQLNFATHQSQKVSLNNLIMALINFFGIIYLITSKTESSILYSVMIFSLSITSPYLYATYEFFRKKKELIPNITFFKKQFLKNILNKGSKILFVQIGFLLIIGIDRLILLKYGSASEVTEYEIIYKVMSIIIFPVSIIIAPLWSSFSEAYEKNDILWIKKIFKNFYLLMIFIFTIILFLTFSFNYITHYWLNDFPIINFYLIFTMGCLIFCLLWSNFHSDFLLGVNKHDFIIKMIFIGLLLKFTILFLIQKNNFNISLFNVIISSLSGYLFIVILTPLYIKKLIKEME